MCMYQKNMIIIVWKAHSISTQIKQPAGHKEANHAPSLDENKSRNRLFIFYSNASLLFASSSCCCFFCLQSDSSLFAHLEFQHRWMAIDELQSLVLSGPNLFFFSSFTCLRQLEIIIERIVTGSMHQTDGCQKSFLSCFSLLLSASPLSPYTQSFRFNTNATTKKRSLFQIRVQSSVTPPDRCAIKCAIEAFKI